MTVRSSIPGRLDMAALAALSSNLPYDARANQHRPTDPRAIDAEMRRLKAAGLTARDISTALRIDLAHVSNVVEHPSVGQARSP